MMRTFFGVFVVLLICGCSTRLLIYDLKEAKVQAKTEYPSFTDSTFTKLLFKIEVASREWYKGQQVIAEKVASRSHTENGKMTESLVTTAFVFMDFKRKLATEYLTFSDTARPVKTFPLYDTVKLSGGDYHWGAAMIDTTNLSRQVRPLADTIIDNITYKRAARIYPKEMSGKPKDYVELIYFRPDVSQGLARTYFWKDSLTRAFKAPIVWVEERFEVDDPRVLAKAALTFLSNSLTAEEKKVFAAWEKNIRQLRPASNMK